VIGQPFSRIHRISDAIISIRWKAGPLFAGKETIAIGGTGRGTCGQIRASDRNLDFIPPSKVEAYAAKRISPTVHTRAPHSDVAYVCTCAHVCTRLSDGEGRWKKDPRAVIADSITSSFFECGAIALELVGFVSEAGSRFGGKQKRDKKRTHTRTGEGRFVRERRMRSRRKIRAGAYAHTRRCKERGMRPLLEYGGQK